MCSMSGFDQTFQGLEQFFRFDRFGQMGVETCLETALDIFVEGIGC